MTTVKNYWKQFAAWVIASKSNAIARTRFRLTVSYIFVLLVMLVAMNAVFLQTRRHDISVGLAGYFEDAATELQVTGRIMRELAQTSLMATLGVGLATGILGYILAYGAFEAIERNIRIQKRFIRDTSHELRTPLSIMKTNLEVALMGNDIEPNARALLVSNLDEVNRMAEILKNLLSLSKIASTTGSDLIFSRVDLSEALLRAAPKLEKIAKAKNIDFSIMRADQAFIRGDRMVLEDLFFCLVKNAVTHTPEGGKINISLTRNMIWADLCVEDTGTGIAEIDLPYVFEPFYRADEARTRIAGSYGLGLSICKEIMSRHKGTISIKKTSQTGTTMEMRFPLLARSIFSSYYSIPQEKNSQT